MTISVRSVLRHHFRHFNARTLVDAADAWAAHADDGGKMMVTLAGAMSTAELGISLAEMIRRDKVHAITTTGANLEEDVFNLVAQEHYVRVPDPRSLTAEQEAELRDKGLNRVADTCIPEEEAMRKVERPLLELWQRAERDGRRHFPHEYLYELLLSGALAGSYQVDPRHSWLLAAAEKRLPIFVPGWEDSTLGNVFVASVMRKELETWSPIRGGAEYMAALADWYRETSSSAKVGFFQIGGGIAGDFPICVVPMLRLDLEEEVPYWSYFCQISDSTPSFGSYSGAPPNEKITWHKVDVDTPRFVIESDATIVAPLVFSYVLNCWGVSQKKN
ncbi:deoxyhypusine synthase family protein [Myxococcus sp. AB036A]|uniref:deoxyhypusine synthase family protein n=1 Tax=Myxococcus sp. AB036A TaxID=2562793 RepID=UPI0011461321|nr:deoxyhypusine synthase family protein [Myxococcus sp. AB036A]